MNERPTSPLQEGAHDVLAAEEFAMPAPDPALHHPPIVAPEDPVGITEPHDVLAADEYPMPAPRSAGAARALARHAGDRWRGVAVAAAGTATMVGLARRLSRR
ncbi:MAG: hypothetical protein JO153_18785 [Solirubrobacterales bacterium]|nr:hypothetical protein [Solirubrobacterales bacterium]MBV9918552.1 hypothetical protein [Solirubrobacterales bacterium]